MRSTLKTRSRFASSNGYLLFGFFNIYSAWSTEVDVSVRISRAYTGKELHLFTLGDRRRRVNLQSWQNACHFAFTESSSPWCELNSGSISLIVIPFFFFPPPLSSFCMLHSSEERSSSLMLCWGFSSVTFSSTLTPTETFKPKHSLQADSNFLLLDPSCHFLFSTCENTA